MYFKSYERSSFSIIKMASFPYNEDSLCIHKTFVLHAYLFFVSRKTISTWHFGQIGTFVVLDETVLITL